MGLELTVDNFDAEISKGGVVLVDFWAAWCGPCKVMSPLVDELAEESKSITVGKVDADAQPDLVRQYNIRSIPTFLVFKGGQVVDQFQGVMSKEVLKERVEQFI